MNVNTKAQINCLCQFRLIAADHLSLKANGELVDWGGVVDVVESIPPVLQGLSNVVAIADGLVLRENGSVTGWGYIDAGPGPYLLRIQPEVGLENVAAIAARPDSSLVLKRDGTWI